MASINVTLLYTNVQYVCRFEMSGIDGGQNVHRGMLDCNCV